MGAQYVFKLQIIAEDFSVGRDFIATQLPFVG